MSDDVFPAKYTDVMAAVAAAYNLKNSDLKTWGRASRPIEEARRVTYALLKSECWLSWRDVAHLMGRSSDGTASWIATAARRADPAAVKEIRARLHNGHQPELWP